MLALVQRVAEASVSVDAAEISRIGQGLLVFVCVQPQDTPEHAAKLVDKLLKLRIFSDEAGRMNRSVQDIGGALLLVSQFTLAADTSSGNRPSFAGAASPELGRRLYDAVFEAARTRHPQVAAGVFGADMKVRLLNDGPVTIPLAIV